MSVTRWWQMTAYKSYTINQLIKKAFLIPSIAIFFFVFSIVTYMVYKTFQENQIKNSENLHAIISRLVRPYLVISDTQNIRKFLTLMTQPGQILAVIDNNGDIIMSDYADLKITSSSTVVNNGKIKCEKNFNRKTTYFEHNKYSQFCTEIKLSSGDDQFDSKDQIGLLLSFNKENIFPFSLSLFLYLSGFVFIVILLLTRWIYVFLKGGVLDPLNRLKKYVFSDQYETINIEKFFGRKKVINEAIEFGQLFEKFFEKIEKNNLIKKEVAIGKLAAQVAHDIRSPLATINVVVKESSELEEQKRIMLRNATRQLNDIANVLLLKYRSKNDFSPIENNTATNSEVIAVLLDLIVSEKRLQYKHLPVTIEFSVDANARGVFAQIVVPDFKRVISNIINNAVEALNGKGAINIHLSQSDDKVIVEISDNGVGMSQEVIAQVFDGSIKSSKKEGSGIGLVSACQLIKSWGGELTITSEMNVGTTLRLSFMLLDPASWFANKLNFAEGATVVILDDDQSIHDLWESRFVSFVRQGHVRLRHFYQADEVIRSDMAQMNDFYFLCDYELIGQEKTGLDVIEQLQLGKFVTLVTSRYEDHDVRRRCAKLGIKILPKNYAAYVPICILPKEKEIEKTESSFDLVLIDDDPLVISTWEYLARLKNKTLLTFVSFEAAESALECIDRNTVIYIDSNLGTDIPGEEYAKRLYEKGFMNIYLATGYSSDSFEEMYWLKGIVGKEPRF